MLYKKKEKLNSSKQSQQQAIIVSYYENPPQFLQPITQYWLPFDIFINLEKNYSFISSQNNFKKVFEYNLSFKKTNMDYLEVMLMNFSNYCTPIELFLDRILSLGNKNAKQCYDLINKLNEFSKNEIVFNDWDYTKTKEYKNYQQTVQNFRINKRMEAFFLVQGKFDHKLKYVSIYKESFSKKFIDIIYNGDINLFEMEILKSNNIPFFGYCYENLDFEYFANFLNETFFKKKLSAKKKFEGQDVFLSKDGDKSIKSKLIHNIFCFVHPKYPNFVLEMTMINIYKPISPNEFKDFSQKESIYEDKNIKLCNENIINRYFSN